MSSYYITTPIYYVNDIPHIGHAYTTVASDVIARFMRLDTREVFFLTGTDEHGQKVAKSAQKNGMSPQSFVDKMCKPFQELCTELNIANTDFIRTTDQRHKKCAQYFWNILKENGHIYKGKYKGWYSVRDEAFYSEDEIKDGLAPTGAPVEWMEEESYFFNLSQWQDKLLQFYDDNPGFIKPDYRKKEIVNFVKSGLRDLSISRTTMKWGVPVPGDSDHVMYVWLDALTNYISALGYPEKTEIFNQFWPAQLHIVGKDILRFHAVYWPAFLMAAGIDLPKRVFAHGWWTNEGQKISKSVGNVIDPFEISSNYGVDYFRYYMIREVIFGNDGNFSEENFVSRINSELVNKIGNLTQRTLVFIYNNLNGKIPHIYDKEYVNKNNLIYDAHAFLSYARDYIENQNTSEYIEGIISLASNANVFIDTEAPWNLKKENTKKMADVLYIITEVIKCIAIYLQPIIPEKSSEILDQLKIEPSKRIFRCIKDMIKEGTEIQKPRPLFNKLTYVKK